jgi:hypothetical protein
MAVAIPAFPGSSAGYFRKSPSLGLPIRFPPSQAIHYGVLASSPGRQRFRKGAPYQRYLEHPIQLCEGIIVRYDKNEEVMDE